jgi:hypothetical protein
MPSIPRSDIFTAIRAKIAAYMKMYLFITLIYMTIKSIKSPYTAMTFIEKIVKFTSKKANILDLFVEFSIGCLQC